MEAVEKKTRTVSPDETLKVAIRNILYMKSEGEVHGLNSVFAAGLTYAKELTDAYFDELLKILQQKKAEMQGK